jgi:hypothetical protein
MTDMMRFFLIVLISANLFGCAEAYRHPNYEFNSPQDQQNFDKDRQGCASTSERERCTELKEKKPPRSARATARADTNARTSFPKAATLKRCCNACAAKAGANRTYRETIWNKNLFCSSDQQRYRQFTDRRPAPV